MLNDPSAFPFVAHLPINFPISEVLQAITLEPMDRKNMNPNAAIKTSCKNKT